MSIPTQMSLAGFIANVPYGTVALRHRLTATQEDLRSELTGGHWRRSLSAGMRPRAALRDGIRRHCCITPS